MFTCDLQSSRRIHCLSLFKCQLLSRAAGQECCDSACVHVRSLHVETKQFAECSHVICRVRGGFIATPFSNASSYHVRLDKNVATICVHVRSLHVETKQFAECSHGQFPPTRRSPQPILHMTCATHMRHMSYATQLILNRTNLEPD